MSHRAPELPTTQELHEMYPQVHCVESVAINRIKFNQALEDPQLSIRLAGPCGLAETNRASEVFDDAASLTGNFADPDVIEGYRCNVFKPRTNPEDWHGLETTNPELAFKILLDLALQDVTLVQEVAYPDYHVLRYGPVLTSGWSGARLLDAPGGADLITEMALQDITMAYGVKNGMNGRIGPAINLVKQINTLRRRLGGNLGIEPAPAYLIFRGGEKVMTPELWETEYLKALEATEGRLIVDTAHGSSMAHDINDKKSNQGQTSAYKHVIDLTCKGFVPAGIMSEASSLEGRTDPVMPVDELLSLASRLHSVINAQELTRT